MLWSSRNYKNILFYNEIQIYEVCEKKVIEMKKRIHNINVKYITSNIKATDNEINL